MIFKDKSVVITGGSEGVGAAAATLFAAAGANLMLVARSKKNLDAVAAELDDKTRVETFAMDIADADACADLMKKVQFEFGRLDVLVNNAGCHNRGDFESVSDSDLAAMVDVNLRAPIILTSLAIPHLRAAGGGAIVNVGSLSGRTSVPGSATYAATKAALRSLTYSIAYELRDSKIKVATVSPGPIDTGFIMDEIDETADLTFSQPMSTPEEVAQTILDLCGNNIREVTMPGLSGFLTTLTYLFPSLGYKMRPLLERRGAKVKARLKSERKRLESDSPDR